MVKEKFESLLNQITSLIDDCKSCVVYSSDELLKMTLAEIQKRIDKAQDIQSSMDTVLTTELYHILGMGNLSASQQLRFMSKVREYCSYRPYIKMLSQYNLPAVPSINNKAEYRCKTLKIKLTKSIKPYENS